IKPCMSKYNQSVLRNGEGNNANGKEFKCKEHANLVEKEVLPNLRRLQGDEDIDVRYFSTMAAAKFTGEDLAAVGAGAGGSAGPGQFDGSDMHTSP
ncbi:hypothetical protein KEM55_009057, partial [Ascosphaera atra]